MGFFKHLACQAKISSLKLVKASLCFEFDLVKAWGLQVKMRLADEVTLFLSEKKLIIAIKAPITMLLVRQE